MPFERQFCPEGKVFVCWVKQSEQCLQCGCSMTRLKQSDLWKVTGVVRNANTMRSIYVPFNPVVVLSVCSNSALSNVTFAPRAIIRWLYSSTGWKLAGSMHSTERDGASYSHGPAAPYLPIPMQRRSNSGSFYTIVALWGKFGLNSPQTGTHLQVRLHLHGSM